MDEAHDDDAIDLLKELVKEFEYHQYDMVEWTMAAAEVAIKAREWLKENGYEIPVEEW